MYINALLLFLTSKHSLIVGIYVVYGVVRCVAVVKFVFIMYAVTLFSRVPYHIA
jgi:hypothetical protein